MQKQTPAFLLNLNFAAFCWNAQRLDVFKLRKGFAPQRIQYLTLMKNKCPNCALVNFSSASVCARCNCEFSQIAAESISSSLQSKVLKRVGVFLLVCFFSLLAFYLSLIFSAKKLTYDEQKITESGIAVLEAKGFADEVFLLRYTTAFRSNDHWLNASIEKENAYAATNFPFAIMVLYPEFFTVPIDDAERAAILLHEAKHLQGAGEPEAYEFVWKNRRKLGWTKETHRFSVIWLNVRKTTREIAPHLFFCETNEYADCTEDLITN